MTPSRRVSVVIPAYHSHQGIASCLDSLRAQTFRDFEVLVVNSSPEEKTAAVLAHYPEVRFEQSPSRLLPHAARNRGAARASGQILVFTDPDCVTPPAWLGALVAGVDAGHQAVGGSMDLAGRGWFPTGIHLCKFSWALPGTPAGPRAILPTANCAYSRKLWDEIGPFDGSRFSADAILSWKAARAGYPPRFEPKAVVYHTHEGGWRALWRERVSRGCDFAEARMQHEEWTSWRAAAYLVGTPLLLFLLVGRAAIDSLRSGWLVRFLATLPVQIAGQLGWLLGEARAYCERLGGGSTGLASRT
jgi:GT2 family glycosyltransferase